MNNIISTYTMFCMHRGCTYVVGMHLYEDIGIFLNKI